MALLLLLLLCALPSDAVASVLVLVGTAVTALHGTVDAVTVATFLVCGDGGVLGIHVVTFPFALAVVITVAACVGISLRGWPV